MCLRSRLADRADARMHGCASRMGVCNHLESDGVPTRPTCVPRALTRLAAGYALRKRIEARRRARMEDDMGNRAVITDVNRTMGVYLHWNGGRQSVEAFLKYCDLCGYRSPTSDDYGWARLCQVIGNYFGPSGLSVGIRPYTNDDLEDPGDNGIYVIDGWDIVDRVRPYGWDDYEWEEEVGHDLTEMLHEIDSAQPARGQLGAFIDATAISRDDLAVGDTVWRREWDSHLTVSTIAGFVQEDEAPRPDLAGLPYTNLYPGDAADPRNIIQDKVVYRASETSLVSADGEPARVVMRDDGYVPSDTVVQETGKER